MRGRGDGIVVANRRIPSADASISSHGRKSEPVGLIIHYASHYAKAVFTGKHLTQRYRAPSLPRPIPLLMRAEV
jgi:hypothetical protein